MANNIGTHLAVKLEEISELHMVMDGLSNLGADLSSYSAHESFVNVFQWCQQRHNVLFDELHTYLLKQVVPIVSHINDRV